METGQDLRYDISVISQDEFEDFNNLVLSVFDEGKQWYKPKLMTVSHNFLEMPKIHHESMAKSTCLGVAMADEGKHHDEFHIWINPQWRAPVFKFYMLLAHELCHGYVGLQYDHTPSWRRWFYRTLWHLNEARMVPKPEDELKYVCVMVEMEYNKKPKVDPMLSILEAFHQAEREHDKVMDNYVTRISRA